MQHKSTASTKCTATLGDPSFGSPPGPRVAAGPPVPLPAAVGPRARLEAGNRAQGCQCSRISRGPEKGRQTQQNRCSGKAHEADRRLRQPSGPTRSLETSGRPWQRLEPGQERGPPALQPGRGGNKDGGGAQAVAGSSPGTRRSCEKRLPRQIRLPVLGSSPMWVCDPERTPSTSVRKKGDGTRALWIIWRGPGVYSRVPCADPVLLATPDRRGQPLPGRLCPKLVSASAHPSH